MILRSSELSGVAIVELEQLHDERGFFARTFDRDAFASAGLASSFDQQSIAYNAVAGTIRGLHFQRAPHAEAKIVRCLRGAIYDVAVDLRQGSPTFGHWIAVRLDDVERRALYIAPGFAHGYQTLVDGSEVSYMISSPYAAESAGGVRYDDPRLAIPWPLPLTVISDRDRAFPALGDISPLA